MGIKTLCKLIEPNNKSVSKEYEKSYYEQTVYNQAYPCKDVFISISQTYGADYKARDRKRIAQEIRKYKLEYIVR